MKTSPKIRLSAALTSQRKELKLDMPKYYYRGKLLSVSKHDAVILIVDVSIIAALVKLRKIAELSDTVGKIEIYNIRSNELVHSEVVC